MSLHIMVAFRTDVYKPLLNKRKLYVNICVQHKEILHQLTEDSWINFIALLHKLILIYFNPYTIFDQKFFLNAHVKCTGTSVVCAV